MNNNETKKATIFYLLSEEGRRQSLLQGGNGEIVQTIETEVNEQIIMTSSITVNGKINLTMGFSSIEKDGPKGVLSAYLLHHYDNYTGRLEENYNVFYFDKPMKIFELLEWYKNRLEKLDDSKKNYLIFWMMARRKKTNLNSKETNGLNSLAVNI